MPFEQRELTGSLFKNKKREKDSHPNTQGSALIDGVEYWVSGWTKNDKNGDPWISLAFKRKDEKAEAAAPAAPATQQRGKTVAVADSDIPF